MHGRISTNEKIISPAAGEEPRCDQDRDRRICTRGGLPAQKRVEIRQGSVADENLIFSFCMNLDWISFPGKNIAALPETGNGIYLTSCIAGGEGWHLRIVT